MILTRWVQAKTDLTQHLSNGDLAYAIPKGTRGYVFEESDEMYVYFPQAIREFALQELRPVTPPDMDEVFNTIKSFEGHHCKQYGQFQFNIKVHAYDYPDVIEQYSGKHCTQTYKYNQFEDELHFLLDQNESALTKLLDIFKSEWHTAGRQGGWLLLQTRAQTDAEDLQSTWESYDTPAKSDIDSGAKAMYDEEKAEYKQGVLMLYYSLTLIDQAFTISKAQLAEHVKTTDFWDGFLEMMAEEKEAEDGVLDAFR